MKLKNKILRITCDGGAATGKSTGAKLLAKKYKLAFLSSGLLYRYAAYLNLRYKPKNEIFFEIDLTKNPCSMSLRKNEILDFSLIFIKHANPLTYYIFSVFKKFIPHKIQILLRKALLKKTY